MRPKSEAKGLKVRLQGQAFQGELVVREGVVIRLRAAEVTICIPPADWFSSAKYEKRFSLETGQPVVKDRYFDYQIVLDDLEKLKKW